MCRVNSLNKAYKLIYTIIWTLLLPVLSLLSLTVIKKWRDGLKMRLGNFPMHFNPNAIWFHAVSVGELNAILPLLKLFDGLNIILSTSTQTAQNMAKTKLKNEILNNRIQLIYMPWDHPVIVEKTLNKMQPSMLVLMETEIWPALITEAHNRNIPVAVINARLADKSYDAYKMGKSFFEFIFNKISLVLAQSPNDSRKFLELGVSKDKLYMTGNIKFAGTRAVSETEAQRLKKFLGYTDEHCILLAASTHEQEEPFITSIFQELKSDFPNLRLILGPRHPERFDTVEDYVQAAAHLETVRYSRVKEFIKRNDNGSYNFDESLGTAINSANDVLMVDTIGDLTQIMSFASVCFVGGTLNENVGGHNVLEPAVYGVPVLVGAHYFKNTETVQMMKDAGALEVAESLQDLKLVLKNLLDNPDMMVMMGHKSHKLMQKNKQIVAETSKHLKELAGV